VGRVRAQGWEDIVGAKLLESHEGPDATISAVEYLGGERSLVIDGFTAAEELTNAGKVGSEHYMLWMGHLPMLLHRGPKDALVICFGTGQTANAVRRENPATLDIVDLNAHVFGLARYFSQNEHVLSDPRVKAIVMDGRAYMRRANKQYDVITLEPMPPIFAGMNALYSREFYQFARARLRPGGMIAQWVPYHLLDVHTATSIVRTFQEVFPNGALWIDPRSGTGILLGSSQDDGDVGSEWPGLSRTHMDRSLPPEQIPKALALRRRGLEVYSRVGDVITDDNQLLAYGRAVWTWHPVVATQGPNTVNELAKKNMDYLLEVQTKLQAAGKAPAGVSQTSPGDPPANR
jgi:hypothetical protein